MFAFGQQATLLQLAVALICPMSAVAFSMSATPLKTSQTAPLLKTQSSLADEGLRRMQDRHRPIATSFVPSKFNPHPFLTNCHLQTILGVFLRKSPNCAYMSDSGVVGLTEVIKAVSNIQPKEDDKCTFWDERVRITTSCEQDFYSVDIKYAGERKTKYQSEESKGLVVLIHGLESNSNSRLSTDMGQSYVQNEFDVACINFRGCCGVPNNTPGGYHLGFTDDLRHFLSLISDLWETDKDFDKRPVYLSGFSLGANVVVKCLGELGDAAMSIHNVHGAAVCGAPFDGERNIKRFLEGFNKAVYGENFLKTLKKRAEQQLETFADGDPLTPLFDYEGAMSATTIAEYENAVIAKIYGFENNIDYYRQTSCYYFLPGVAVPLFIINAGDDPFFDPDFWPSEESADGGSLAPIKMERAERGGHLGFLFHQLSDSEKKEERTASWMPMELARFITHVHTYETDEK